jgi:hypothetical protein
MSSAGSPSIEAVKEWAVCKVVIWLWKPDSNAIINKWFEKWGAGFVAGNQAFYF